MPSHFGPCVDRRKSLKWTINKSEARPTVGNMLDHSPRVATRAERIDRAVSRMHARFAPLLPGGEVQEAGHAIWTVSATPLLCANGVIRYDARDFHGPASERELDNCLAVLSTYDEPWRFSAWAHLGADVLVPRLIARGMIEERTDQAMWLDLPGDALAITSQDGIEVRPAADPSEYRAWTSIFTKASGISSEYADLLEHMVAKPQWLSLVARANRRPVGCLTLSIERGLAIVHTIGVLPSERRLGVGRRLLLAAHEAAVARGASACVALATPEGSGVCASLGHHTVTSVTYLMSPPREPTGEQPDSQVRRPTKLADQPTMP